MAPCGESGGRPFSFLRRDEAVVGEFSRMENDLRRQRGQTDTPLRSLAATKIINNWTERENGEQRNSRTRPYQSDS